MDTGKKTPAGALLAEARRRSGLSQRQLAARAETAQSVVSRIETGSTDPTTGTLERLVRAAGQEITWALDVVPAAHSHMLDDVVRILSLTPEERIAEVVNFARFERAALRG